MQYAGNLGEIHQTQFLAASLALGVALVPALGTMSRAMAEAQSQKPLESLAMAGNGGGADEAMRVMQSMIAKHEPAPSTVTTVDKASG